MYLGELFVVLKRTMYPSELFCGVEAYYVSR